MSDKNKNDSFCGCTLKLDKTTVSMRNDNWHVKYEWNHLIEWVEYEAEDISQIHFPSTRICPDCI